MEDDNKELKKDLSRLTSDLLSKELDLKEARNTKKRLDDELDESMDLRKKL